MAEISEDDMGQCYTRAAARNTYSNDFLSSQFSMYQNIHLFIAITDAQPLNVCLITVKPEMFADIHFFCKFKRQLFCYHLISRICAQTGK